MLRYIYLLINIALIFKFNYVVADIGTISGYPQVDIRDLNALTLSWNQVGLIQINFSISLTKQIIFN